MFDIKRQSGGYWFMIAIHILKVYVFFAFQGTKIPNKVYNFDTVLTGLCHFDLYEKTFFVKHQPKLYLVDV